MDPKTLAICHVATPTKTIKAPRHRPGERFLRGPIPMVWLFAASLAAGHGAGFQVAITLWYLSGLNKQAKTIKLSYSVLRSMGVKRHAVYRGLKALEKAGLVTVERHQGQSPMVTILDVEAEP